MAGSGPAAGPARALAEVDHLMSAGAAAVRFRYPPWHAGFTCLMCTVVGALHDVPRDAWDGLGPVLRLPVVLALMTTWTVVTPASLRGARPLPRALGPAWPVVPVGFVLLLFCAATGVGLGLQGVGVPLPFTLAGAAYGLGFAAALRPGTAWLSARYRRNVRRGYW